jgi:hypothetical protein
MGKRRNKKRRNTYKPTAEHLSKMREGRKRKAIQSERSRISHELLSDAPFETSTISSKLEKYRKG